MRLSIHPHGILGATGPRERPPLNHHPAQLIDLILNAHRLHQSPLRIRRLEDAPIGHFDAHQPVRQIDVRAAPLGRRPGLVREHDLGEEHVRQRIAHRLVDEVHAAFQRLQRVSLPGRLGLRVAD